jgi:excisionase family DNA binding protein
MHAPALTLKDFCDAYRVCRETAYQQIRTGRLRAVKVGRKTLILRADADAWAASLPELRAVGRLVAITCREEEAEPAPPLTEEGSSS